LDKIALVTGSTNNIGKGIAEKLAQDGFLVIITSRSENEAKKTVASLAKKGDYYRVDFSDARQIQGLFSFIREKYNRLDVLVNNVAFTQNESILGCSLEVWEKTLNTNLRSYFLCSKHAAELMKSSGGGNIVNITIGSGRSIRDKFSYAVSKGGVSVLTLCAAADLAPFNIRVNAIAIGPTGSPVGSKESPDRSRKWENPAAMVGHIGMPADIANAVSFLVSEKAAYIYGAVIPVDGGAR
jgi:NAD(P)-dependent dehydrogenase (short-subunit alcohol dehydrogenase family)